MTNIEIWGYSIPEACLSQIETDYLLNLPTVLPTLEWVWQEMDRVWLQFGLDNKRALKDQSVDDFYRHPVWLMNGVFTAIDPVSFSHREGIARYLGKLGVETVADYGGGFGELAQSINRVIPDAAIAIVEPYPSQVAIERLRTQSGVDFISDLASDHYDAVVAQDILEHVEDPLLLAKQLAVSVRKGGVVIFANCFYPVIQCHLPSTFHLRHTFVWVMKLLGLRYLGSVDGAPHAQVFEHSGELSLFKAQNAEKLSRLVDPLPNHLFPLLSRIKHKVIRE